MPAFARVCEIVAEAWNEQRDDVEEQATKLTGAIDEQVLRPEASGALDAGILAAALGKVRSQFDPEWGGFGRAPKFPQAMTVDFLCRELARRDTPETREMITTSLDAMAAGGIHDQLGGGFARYSTDETWLVPHFEKMLYDNALLTRAYLHAFLVTGEPRYREVVEDIVGYVLRDLTDPAGGFYAAEDADSEGIEGKFYVWSPAEIRDVCGPDADEVLRYYGVTEHGNFIDPHTNFRGSILHVEQRNEPEPEAVNAEPAPAARTPSHTRPSRPRQQGVARMERAVPRRAHRSRGRTRTRRLAARRPHQRAIPLRGAPHARGTIPAIVARSLRRVRGGLRGAARSDVNAGGAR